MRCRKGPNSGFYPRQVVLYSFYNISNHQGKVNILVRSKPISNAHQQVTEIRVLSGDSSKV